MADWRERLLRILGIQARVRASAGPPTPARDPELARVRGVRVAVEAELDLFRLEAANLGAEEDEDAPGPAG